MTVDRRTLRIAATLAISFVATVSSASDIIHLDQSWSDEERGQFYFTSQGSQLIPYTWFAALDLADGSQRLLDADTGLSRYGYLQDPSGARSKMNPDNLPIGFVKDVGTKSGKGCEFVGLTCAACHTSELVHGDTRIIIDGGAAMADFELFMGDLVASLDATAKDDEKFSAFEARLKKGDEPDSCQSNLRLRLAKRHDELERVVRPLGPPHPDLPKWGPGRIDAVGTIVNQILLHLELADGNLAALDAPVNPPFIWDTHDHNQVQWNGVSDLPIVRNTTEVLGVFADYGPDRRGFLFSTYDSTVRVKGLKKLEKLMGELRSPAWPEEKLGAIDEELRSEGEALWNEHCQECHSEVRRDEPIPEITAVMTPLYPLSPNDESNIGTDPGMAAAFHDREFIGDKETLKKHGLHKLSARKTCEELNGQPYKPQAEQVLGVVLPRILGLGTIVGTVLPEFIRRGTLPDVDPNRCAYKGRPLDGIWATAPYLHNGSVPNLEELLKPANCNNVDPSECRVKTFCVSQKPQFSAAQVGISTDSSVTLNCEADEIFDTRKKGNGNGGHEYGTDTLTKRQRSALVEYQKSL